MPATRGTERFRSSRRASGLLAGLLLLLSVSACLAQDAPGRPGPAEGISFRGAVFEGFAGETARPIAGVVVSIHGSDLPYPDPGVRLRSTTTDLQGRFELALIPADSAYAYFHLLQEDLDGYVSIAARSDRGTVRTPSWVEFSAPAAAKSLAGIRFWDMGPRPDLLVGVSSPKIVGDADTLLLVVQVWNSGNAPSSATLVRAVSRGWAREAPVRPLGQRDSEELEIRFAISEEQRGETHEFRVEVDPEQKVAEFNEENNVARATAIEIPSLPDLAVAASGVELLEGGAAVRVLVQVTNRGGLPAPPATVRVSSGSWAGEAAVPALGAGATGSIEVRLDIPPEQRGRAHRFTIEVDPEERVAELNEQNNRDETEELLLPDLPDLVVRAPRVELREGARRLRIILEVENVGGIRAPASTVTASSEGWQGSAEVSSLEAGARVPVEIALEIHARQRGATHAFRVAVDPEDRIPELDEANNVSETTPVTIADLPDLVVRQSTFEILADGRTLKIGIQIANTGGVRSPETLVRAGSEGWNETAAVRSLPAGGTAQVEVWLDIPPERRGKDHVFLVEVDPEKQIVELNERNNTVEKTTAPIPDLPDLVLEVSRLGFVDKERALLIMAVARNVGGAATPSSVVHVRSDGWEERTTVRSLAPGDTARIEFRLAIPEEERGKTHTFEVRIDPSDEIQELDEENNVAWTPGIDIAARAPISPLVWIGAGLVLLVAGSFAGQRLLRRRRRRGWQEEAEEGDLPEAGRPGTYHCRRIEVDVDPGKRKVVDLLLSARRSGSGGWDRTTRFDGAWIGDLNDAVSSWRKDGDPARVREIVLPVARLLLQRLREWLPNEPARLDIWLAGHLRGGRATFEFILYHCERKGSADIWVEEDRWESTVKDARDLSIGLLEQLDPATAEADPTRVEELTRLLEQFVRKV